MKELSKIEKQAAKNLKNIWERYKQKNNTCQMSFCEKIDMKQTLFSFYINGKIAISLRVLVKLSDALGCNCSDIRTDIKDK